MENLNSVLDDNKLLTLPNGERLNLPPNVRAKTSAILPYHSGLYLLPFSCSSFQLRVMFEVQDLKFATLATVSRCGMVWFSEDVLSLDMIFDNFLSRLRDISIDDAEDDRSRFASSREKKTDALSPTMQVTG